MSSPDPHPLPATPPSGPASPRAVGEFTLDVAANELIAGDGGVTRIEPRLMALLLRLARTPGSVVSRETLIDEVWARRMVNDEVLSRAVADLRQALGDNSRTPRYIETIPKSGYRLIAAVAMAEAALPLASATVSAQPRQTSHELPPGPSPSLAKWSVWMAAGLAAILATVAIIVATRPQSRGPGSVERGDWSVALDTALREAKSLTASVGLEIAPRLSPDGKRVLYTLIEAGGASLMLHDPALPAPVRIGAVNMTSTSGVFMPDGVGIILRELGPGRCMLRLLATPDAPPRDIAACDGRDPPRIDLSPDGRALVMSRTHRESFPPGLALVDIAKGETRQLTTPGPGEGEDTLPRFSPDGATIAFVRGNSSARGIWLLPTAGGEPRRLSPLAGLTYGLSWVPDGSALIVAADWFGFRALNRLDVKTGEGRLLGARGARAPDIAGDRIVYENAIYQANLFRVTVSAGGTAASATTAAGAERMHASTRYTSQPAYAPNGAALALVSNREGVEAIYTSHAGAPPRRVPLADTHRYMRPTWSADGKALYAVRMPVAADKSAPQQAVRVDLASGTAQVLALGDNVAWVQESADGRWLYVGEREERLMRLWRAPLDAGATPGKLERLPVPLASDALLSRERIAFTQTGLKGVTLCAPDGQSCALLKLPMGDRHDDHWALTAGGLYFVEIEGAEHLLKRHDLKRGMVTTVSALVPTTLGAGLAVHPGETEIMVAREEAPSIDLMVGTLPRLK